MEASPRSTLPSGKRRLALIIVLGGVSAIGPLSTDLYLPAMPEVARDLGASAHSISLSISIFMVGLALGQLFFGHVSDTYGRRRPLLAGLAVFAVASLLCTFAPSAPVLNVLRALQGVSGGAGVAIGNAVVADYTRGTQAARLLSRLALVTFLAPILAPLLGAQLLMVTSWRGIFVVQGAMGVVLVAGVLAGLPESLPRARRLPLSLGQAGRVMATLTRDRAFMGLAIASALTSVGFFSYLADSSFVVQDVYGASATVYSVLFSVNAMGMLGASQLNHLLLRRFAPQRLLAGGLTAAVVAALGLLAVVLTGGLGLVALAITLFAYVASVGFSGPDSTALALSLHPDTAGSASAYFGTLRTALGGLGSMLLGLGGGGSALPLAVVIAAAALAAAGTYAAVARRVRRVSATLDTPEEAAARAPVG